MEQRSPFKLGFLGGGVMAEAIIRGIIEKKLVDPSSVTVYDVVDSRLELFQKMGVGTCKNSFEILHSDVIVLAVKPDVVAEALRSIKDGWKVEKHLLVSICAGVSIATLEQHLISKSRVIRVMPNTPCLVGEAAVAFSCGSCATKEDQNMVENIFSSVGLAKCVPEKLLDAVTGVSGSGPAYVYMFIEALADGGVLNGLPRDISLSLATQTVLGAAKMVASGEEHPAKLRNAVESPGGTTVHGTSTLEKHHFRNAVIQAVSAATNRAKELGGKKYILESKKNWDLFYKRNGVRFFRDRYWTLNETREDGFYDLLQSWIQQAESEGRLLYILEAGCGVGNTIFPILVWNNSIHFYACDISEEAIRLLQENPAFDSKRIHCFVSDLSKNSLRYFIPHEAQVDVAIVFFSLSAIAPEYHKSVIENIYNVLRPGGWILFRDFCEGDLAQSRFSKESQVEDQWFVRQDGTFSYFFRKDQVKELFEAQGLKTDKLNTVDRSIENRKLGKKMERRWLQGCFQKKAFNHVD